MVEAPVGTRMQLRADLFQLAGGGVAAPLQRDVPVSPELTFEIAGPRTITAALPAVADMKIPTRMRLVLRACAGEPPVALATSAVEVIVYPTETPDEWKKFFAAGFETGRPGEAGTVRKG